MIKYLKVAEADDKEVPALEIVKGYEYKMGRRVTPTAEDSQKEPIESTHAVETTDFLEQATISTKYCYEPYFLEAKNGGEKVYLFLHRAHTETEEFGIANPTSRIRGQNGWLSSDRFANFAKGLHYRDAHFAHFSAVTSAAWGR